MNIKQLREKYYKYHNIAHRSENTYSENYVKFLERQVIKLSQKDSDKNSVIDGICRGFIKN